MAEVIKMPFVMLSQVARTTR